MYLTPTVNFCQSHQAFGSLRSSYADLASNYNCNYYNLETLNDELRTKTEQDLFMFHVNIRSVIENEDELIENISAMRFPLLKLLLLLKQNCKRTGCFILSYKVAFAYEQTR